MLAVSTLPLKSLVYIYKAMRSPLHVVGAKSKAIDTLAPRIPDKFNEYREPFCGGASVFFYCRSNDLAQQYWINDLYEPLITFWRNAKDPEMNAHMQKRLKWLHSILEGDVDKARELFKYARNGDTCQSEEKAIKYFINNRMSFGGSTDSGGFSKSAGINLQFLVN